MAQKVKIKGPQFSTQLVSTVLFFIALTAVYVFFSERRVTPEVVPLSTLVQSISDGDAEKVVVKGNTITTTKKDGSVIEAKKESEAAFSETLRNYGVPAEAIAAVSIDIQNESGFGYWIVALLPFLVPLLFIGFMIWMLTRQVKGANTQAFSFGQSRARMTDPADEKTKVTFKDVAGAKEAKEELTEIVDFLKNPKKFIDIGARIPKGVLLTGSPGTGKTLLARAVAGEAGVPFLHLSGSEFVEMFVGVGASRVRDLFKMAKRAAPAIIFIDEIDAVGRVRGTGIGGGNDEREQTLNQILVEMDGFEPTEKVIVMAATNRSDVLDPALLRPGRFDRRVTIDLPDRSDRLAIMEIHAQKKPFEKDVDLSVIATRTPGFSGADLYSLMNEAAITAARHNRKKVAQKDLIAAIEKVLIGPERRSHLLTPKEKELTAYHEAGHALVASVLPYADPVHKVSIIARGHAGGYTLKLPIEERKLQSKKEFLDDLAVSLGGYAAETLIYNDVTTGPSNDLQVASNLARAMVARWGMNDAIGPVAFESSGGKALFGQGVEEAYSQETAARIDAEVRGMMEEARARALEVLMTHRTALDAIAQKLIEVENLEQDAYEALLQEHGIPLKQ